MPVGEGAVRSRLAAIPDRWHQIVRIGNQQGVQGAIVQRDRILPCPWRRAVQGQPALACCQRPVRPCPVRAAPVRDRRRRQREARRGRFRGKHANGGHRSVSFASPGRTGAGMAYRRDDGGHPDSMMQAGKKTKRAWPPPVLAPSRRRHDPDPVLKGKLSAPQTAFGTPLGTSGSKHVAKRWFTQGGARGANLLCDRHPRLTRERLGVRAVPWLRVALPFGTRFACALLNTIRSRNYGHLHQK